MENTFIDIRLEGDNFSPVKLKSLTNLPIEIIAQKGAIAQKGRYRGKPYPYGMALIKVDGKDERDFNIILSAYLAILLKDGKKALKQSGVEEIIVDVETPSRQDTKFSFDEKLIREISNLNARIEFQTSEEEDLPLYLMKSFYKSIHNEEYIKLSSKKKVNEFRKLLERTGKYFTKHYNTDTRKLNQGRSKTGSRLQITRIKSSKKQTSKTAA